MKRKFFLPLFISAIFLLQFSVASAQIITNGGFENWSVGPSGYPDPDGCLTSNTPDAATILQAPGRSGIYSVRLIKAAYFNGTDTIYHYGWMQWSYNGSFKPLSISGYWKGDFTGVPGIWIHVAVNDTGGFALGAGGVSSNNLNLSDWTYFNGIINYNSSTAPLGTVFINIDLISNDPTTTGYIDDLTMTYATGISDLQTTHLLGSYISPDQTGNHFLNLNLSTPSSITTAIFSAEGKKVFSRIYSLPDGEHKIFLPTENLSQGIYFCRVTGDNNFLNKSFKFIKP